MTDRQKELIKKLGLKESDFEPTEETVAEKAARLEKENQELIEAILEMSEIVYS